jgi:hypothetical protein
MKVGLFPAFADEDETTKHTIAGHSDSKVMMTTIDPVIAQLTVLYSHTHLQPAATAVHLFTILKARNEEFE